jgi:hypothetical protein
MSFVQYITPDNSKEEQAWINAAEIIRISVTWIGDEADTTDKDFHGRWYVFLHLRDMQRVTHAEASSVEEALAFAHQLCRDLNESACCDI